MFSNKEEKKVEAEIISSSNTIGKGTVLYGDIETHGNLRIEGKVEGNIKTKSKIVLGKSSVVIGNIKAQNAEIEGSVTGKVNVADNLILKHTSVIQGDVITNKLIVESGSQFNGSCKMENGQSFRREPEQREVNIKPSFKEPEKARTV